MEVQSQAQRALANLPPEISFEEMDQRAKVFAASVGGFDLSPIATPSKGYFEMKILGVQSTFKAEPWTTVTNLAQEEAHRSRPAQSQSDLLSWDAANSGFRLQQKSFGTAMPSTSEGFRMLLRLWGLVFVFLKQRFPRNPHCSRHPFDSSTVTRSGCLAHRSGEWSQWAPTPSPCLVRR